MRTEQVRKTRRGDLSRQPPNRGSQIDLFRGNCRCAAVGDEFRVSYRQALTDGPEIGFALKAAKSSGVEKRNGLNIVADRHAGPASKQPAAS
jgi:hypothetical protein